MSRNLYLEAMEITQWCERSNKETSMTGDVLQEAPAVALSKLGWEELESTVSGCQLCPLSQSRTQTVFGTGHREADLFIVGEAPGANEDIQGKPFVGRAGNLLTSMLQAIGLDRNEVYIGNILKCRPPNNRDPNPREVATCTPYLQQQIELLKPKVMLALGRIAAQFLLDTTTPIGKLRSQAFQYGPRNTPLLITYHPAYLLRSPREKRKSYEDLILVNQYLQSHR